MTENRLDQIERLVAANAEAIAANTEAIAANTEAIAANTEAIAANTEAIAELRSSTAELRFSVNALVQIAELHQNDLEASQRNFDIIVNEIRGLRTESQGILEYLFSSL
jgi:chromosome segregation ATPase